MEKLRLVEKDPLLKSVKILWDINGDLFFYKTNVKKRVRPMRLFPHLSTQSFISLRDEEGKEIHLVEKLADLDPASAKALLAGLSIYDFVFEVKEVYSIEESFELRVYNVETQVGKRRFVTGIEDYPSSYNDNGLILIDECKDTYAIPDVMALPQKSQTLLWPYFDSPEMK
ncbi:MAG: DUF1854 domain-containing protein [Bacteriovoracaceae bacterium]|jgi:hypothetical protein|nr:DUF1854 domain-containing protein [Bacteriovoracaceae bacterium]